READLQRREVVLPAPSQRDPERHSAPSAVRRTAGHRSSHPSARCLNEPMNPIAIKLLLATACIAALTAAGVPLPANAAPTGLAYLVAMLGTAARGGWRPSRR